VTRRAVLDAATRLIEDQGVPGLSMRKLAAELGVAVTSIYWHVGNRDALLDELVQEMVHGLAPCRPAGRRRRRACCRSRSSCAGRCARTRI
jgi:AcrR family transcriptional regulator